MKKLYIICALVLLCTSVFAKHSDDFLIGDYSFLYLPQYNPEYLGFMQNAYFNNMRVRTEYNNYYTVSFQNLLETFDNMGFDAIVEDRFNSGPYHSSYGSFYEFEAEYTIPSGSWPSYHTNHKWFYGLEYKDSTDTVAPTNISLADNNTVLKCSPIANSTGYMACENLRVRETMISSWINGSASTLLTGVMLTSEEPGLINDIYINYRFKPVNYGNGNLFQVGLKIAAENESGFVEFIEISSSVFQSCNPSIYNGVRITKSHYENENLIKDPNGYASVEYKLSLIDIEEDIKDQLGNDFKLAKYWWGKIRYISPTLFYKNNGDLYIDKITMQDDLSKSLREANSPLLSSIDTRLDQYVGNDNIYYLDSLDEPLPSQFDSFKKINEKALAKGLHMITAVNGYGGSGYLSNGYSLMKHYKEETNSSVFCPDYYLYGNQKVEYNQPISTTGAYEHILEKIGGLCDTYRRTKELSQSNFNNKFMPVVQTFGEWNKVDRYWSNIMQPPDAQQKMLMYLPMCYGPDGIFTFEMMSNVDLANLNTLPGNPPVNDRSFTDFRSDSDPKIAAINIRGGITETTSQYQVIKDALYNIKKIGSITKDLSWKGAGNLMPNSSLITLQNTNITVNGSVINPMDDMSVTPSYSGYVQYGAYTDTDNQVYLMLVNKRTNKRLLGQTNIAVNQIDVNNVFATASPQVVHLQINNLPQNQVVSNALTGVVYPLNNGAVDIEIEAGDGLFIKIGNPMAPNYISANEVVTLSNQKIYHDIKNEGTLILNNNVEFVNAHIINKVNGHLNISNANLKSTLQNEAFIKNQGNVSIISSNINAQSILNEGSITLNNNIEFENTQITNSVNAQLIVNNAEVTSKFIDKAFIENHGNASITNSTINTRSIAIANEPNSFLEVDNSHINADEACIQYANNSFVIVNDSELASHEKVISTLPRRTSAFTVIEIKNSLLKGNLRSGIGIEYRNDDGSYLEIDNSIFQDFDTAIDYCALITNLDKIINSNFNQNNTGIRILGEGSISPISNCEFTDNNIGIESIFTNTKITDCVFSRLTLNNNNTTNMPMGIRMENNYVFPVARAVADSLEEGEFTPDLNWQIRNCQFDDIQVGIEVLGSSPRMTNNIFKSKKNLRLLNNAFPDLSYNAYNEFGNGYQSLLHVWLLDKSSLKLKSGHNNFYNPASNGYDFYLTIQTEIPSVIRCSKNYWDVAIGGVYVKYPSYSGEQHYYDRFFDTTNLDPVANQTTPFIIDNQIDQARLYIMSGEYLSALLIYKNVMINQIESEKDYWKESIDECFNITGYLKGDFNALLLIYQNLKDNPPAYLTSDENDDYISLLTEYEKRCYMLIEGKSNTNYAPAKEILYDIIENDDDEINVICSEINLDNILLLEALQEIENKSSDYTESHTTINDIRFNKESKYQRLNQLLNPEDTGMTPIPKALFVQNYPNPFNPSTTLQFGLKQDSKVRINIYNIKGQKVKTLINENLPAGVHNVLWDGKDNTRSEVSSGVYFYNIETNHGSITRKMLMIK